jgi:glycine cleavage system H lipoate-binding protein
MTTSISVLEGLGIFLAGMTGRLVLFLAGAAVLALPALAIAWARNARASSRERARARAGPFTYRGEAFHAPTHTWLAPRKDGLDVGIDDFGQRLLPSVTAIDLPRVGARVRRGEPAAVLHAGRLSVRLPAPVDGTVRAVNRHAANDPGVVKREHGDAWLFRVAPSEPGYLRFRRGGEVAPWLAAEQARLARFVEGELGFAAADGGELPGPWQIGDEEWERMVGTFLEG